MGNLIQVLQFFGGIPTFFVLFVIFLFVFRHHLSKNDDIERKNREKFWQHEQASLVVRKKEIPEDLYIVMDTTVIPPFTKEDYALMNNTFLYTLQESLHLISNSKMLDLSYMLNSDIRLNYGTANLPFIEACEENYLNCLKNIYKLAKGLYEKGYVDEAVKLLDEGVRINTDITYHYELMATIYSERKEDVLIQALINTLQSKDKAKFSKIITLLENFALNKHDHIH